MSISELAEATEVTPRTVRFYVAEGLLPAPSGSGQQREYSRDHLIRLRAIKRLKDIYLPLNEIRRRLAEMSPDELEALGNQPEPPPPASALEYLAKVMPALRSRKVEEHFVPRPTPAAPAPAAASAPPGPRSSDWRRIDLAPGIELHVRVSTNSDRNAAITALAADFARQLLQLPPETAGGVRS